MTELSSAALKRSKQLLVPNGNYSRAVQSYKTASWVRRHLGQRWPVVHTDVGDFFLPLELHRSPPTVILFDQYTGDRGSKRSCTWPIAFCWLLGLYHTITSMMSSCLGAHGRAVQPPARDSRRDFALKASNHTCRATSGLPLDFTTTLNIHTKEIYRHTETQRHADRDTRHT